MTDKVFNPDWSKPRKLSFWLRLKLFFKPIYYSYDIGSKESTVIWFKENNGKIHLINKK